MRDPEHQPEAALLKTPVGTAITAVIGTIVGALSLLVFVFDLLVTPEIGALIISFVVCGIGLTTGFIMLRRLLPRREPISLFAGLAGVPFQPTTQAEKRAQVEQLSRNRAEAAIAMPLERRAEPISHSNQHGSISRYSNARESSGALVFATAIGVSLILGGRLVGGWVFLSLVVPAGGVVALVLNYVRSRQDWSISGYKIPVAGGVVFVIAMIGVGLVMVPFHFLRDFLGLAVGGGCVVALALDRVRRRRESSNVSLV
jgi:hypothetical protein